MFLIDLCNTFIYSSFHLKYIDQEYSFEEVLQRSPGNN